MTGLSSAGLNGPMKRSSIVRLAKPVRSAHGITEADLVSASISLTGSR